MLSLSVLLPLLTLLSLASACNETITTPCCANAYQAELACETKVYTKYGHSGGRQSDRALDKCFNAFSDSCEDVINHSIVVPGVVKIADLTEFGIV
ncbi:hypothetical protein B0J14DRAFT_583445 [Halenospora varia]|nr:hypothetical protein B0J14DRAFT_583445 [Halenospora varia]